MRQTEFAEKDAEDLGVTSRSIVWTLGVALLVGGFIAACREDREDAYRGEFLNEDSKAA
ncbi:MAG TPA: hypothetical protein VG322_04135 [Candidatus Acidoferrales bacterium]|jgi:hypothetical protein|nr:hypothetical protein [Candidatus Acidoferrales bacterium]